MIRSRETASPSAQPCRARMKAASRSNRRNPAAWVSVGASTKSICARVALVVTVEQVGQEAGGELREQSDPHVAFFRTTERCGLVAGFPKLIQPLSCPAKISLPRQGEVYPARVLDEQRDANLILQILHAPADGRFLDLKSHRHFAEASTLGARRELAQMTQFDRG